MYYWKLNSRNQIKLVNNSFFHVQLFTATALPFLAGLLVCPFPGSIINLL